MSPTKRERSVKQEGYSESKDKSYYTPDGEVVEGKYQRHLKVKERREEEKRKLNIGENSLRDVNVDLEAVTLKPVLRSQAPRDGTKPQPDDLHHLSLDGYKPRVKHARLQDEEEGNARDTNDIEMEISAFEGEIVKGNKGRLAELVKSREEQYRKAWHQRQSNIGATTEEEKRKRKIEGFVEDENFGQEIVSLKPVSRSHVPRDVMERESEEPVRMVVGLSHIKSYTEKP